MLLTRDNRSDGTTCSKSDETNSLFQNSADPSRVVFVKSAATLLSDCAKPVHKKQFLSGHNNVLLGKQIENVSKEKNRTKWTLPASLSHSSIAIGNINCKSRCFI
jgi:hypothetical protein